MQDRTSQTSTNGGLSRRRMLGVVAGGVVALPLASLTSRANAVSPASEFTAESVSGPASESAAAAASAQQPSYAAIIGLL